MWCLWLGIAVSVLSRVWHCEISARISVRNLDEDLGHSVSCNSLSHERCKLYYSFLSSVYRHNRGNDKGGLESRKWNTELIRKAVFHKKLVMMALLWFPPDRHLSDNAVLPRMWA